MTEVSKLGLRLIAGIALWIGGTFLLFQIFGDSKLIALLAIGGWFMIAAYTVKYFGLLKKRKSKHKFDRNK